MLSTILLIIVGLFIFGVMVYGLGILILSKNEYEDTSSLKSPKAHSSAGKIGSPKK